MAKKENRFCPDVAIPPGVTLIETLEEIGMTQAEFAERTGRPKKTINEIIKGKVAITPETALQFERVLNVPARFWNNLELNYRETLARIEEKEALKEQVGLIKALPIKNMIGYKWIREFNDTVQQLEEVLAFFGVASVRGWEKTWDRKLCSSFYFRKSEKFALDKVALSAWLRQGQIEANKINCNSYDAKKFEAILPEARSLTVEDPEVFVPKLQELCAKVGVAVVFIRELPKVPVNGVTHWLTTNKAIIQLSLRYKSDDQLWFSFFHESGHVLMHGKRDFVDGDFFEEETADSDSSQWEDEANQFAAQILIPKSAYDYFVDCRSFSDNSILKFAKSQGISPGIVVGRLQHDRHIGFSKLNYLKQGIEWA